MTVRAAIRAMAGYAPGEQPRDDAFVKLNTNENPYPPSPRVFEAIRAALTGDRLRKYPDPTGNHFRQTAARVLGVDPEALLIGNGSDDILTIVTRTFVPEGGLIVAPTPSYILYRSLAEIQGACFQAVPFTADSLCSQLAPRVDPPAQLAERVDYTGWQLPDPWPLPDAHLTFLPNPNSPSGTMIAPAALERLADQLRGGLVLDEAYVDFAETNGLALARRPNVIVTRSLSKSYALAGIRFGFAVANPTLVRELVKVKDSYNCDVLSLAAAAAALDDQDYLRATRDHILATRQRLTAALRGIGFDVCASQANFVWCRHPTWPLKMVWEALKSRRVLVRYMSYEGYGDGLRISVGSDPEVDRLLAELTDILAGRGNALA